jgi:hypothetical protein
VFRGEVLLCLQRIRRRALFIAQFWAHAPHVARTVNGRLAFILERRYRFLHEAASFVYRGALRFGSCKLSSLY